MKHTNKLRVFFEIAKQLNLRFDCKPILYGSLGLAQLIDIDIDVDDVDILIESHMYDTQLAAIRAEMARIGFKLINEEENEFLRDDIKVGIASDGDLLQFATINPNTLSRIDQPACARVLNLEQYLRCYRASQLDSYRRDTHQKDDQARVELILKFLDLR